MTHHHTRRNFLRTGSALAFSASTALAENAGPTQTGIERVGGPALKVSLNAYSFSKLLNDFNKHREGGGISLMQLLDFCAKNNFDGIDPTGYFFPGYPEVPTAEYVNNFNGVHSNLVSGSAEPGSGITSPLQTNQCGTRPSSISSSG